MSPRFRPSNSSPPRLECPRAGWRLDARADMATEPRTIKGPCFDCDDALDDAWEFCPCSRRGLRAERDTEPTPKLEPEELRPNVPPRMW